MRGTEQFFDPSIRARTMAGDLRATADTLSCLIGYLSVEIENSDPGTAKGRDARLLAIHSSLTSERNRLRRSASDLDTLSFTVADVLNQRGAA